MKYAFMSDHSGEHRVTTMARILDVSASGYYAWCKRTEPGPRAIFRRHLDERVAAAFWRFKRRYGAPRITRFLREHGHGYDE